MKIKKILKKFKALIIIIIACLVAGTNYLLYPIFIKNDLKLVEVPIVKETLTPGTLITEEMLTTILSNKDVIPENIIFNKEEIVNRYVSANYTIPTNGFIYTETITTQKESLGTVYYRLEEGQVAYTVKIDNNQYKDDKFKVGQLVDIYFRSDIPQEAGVNYLIGKLGSNIKIINITKDGDVYLTLSLNEEDLKYYLIAEKVGEIIPIIEIKEEDFKEIYSEIALKSYLETKASVLTYPVQVTEEDTNNQKENTNAE